MNRRPASGPWKALPNGGTRSGRTGRGSRVAWFFVTAVLVLLTGSLAWAQTDPPADIQLRGEVRDDGFGGSVTAAGDVNGGFRDDPGGLRRSHLHRLDLRSARHVGGSGGGRQQ